MPRPGTRPDRAIRLLALLGAPLLAALFTLMGSTTLARWQAVTALAIELLGAPPPPERYPILTATLAQLEAAPAPPPLLHALRATLELLQEHPAEARAALERLAAAPEVLDGALGRYLGDRPEPVFTSSSEALARVLDGWRLARREDTEPLARLLAARPRGQEPDFHEAYLEFLLHVRRQPMDHDGAREHLDLLRQLVDRPPRLAHLGFGPAAFDPVVTADPDGSLVLRETPWRGALVPIRQSQRMRRADVFLAVANLHRATGDAHRSLFQAEILDENYRAELEARGLGRDLDLLLYPRPHRSAVRSAARRYGVDPYLLYAVAREESKFRAEAGSQAGAQGLMQIMPATAQWIAQQRGEKGIIGVRELREPEVNLDLGAWYLDYLAGKFSEKGHRLKWTLAAYNGGLGNASRWLSLHKARRGKEPEVQPEDVIDFVESRDYVRKVLASQARYHELYQDPEG